MTRSIDAYLTKRAVHETWSPFLGNADPAGLRQAVVLPVLAEAPNLFLTLGDLAANSPQRLLETLVLGVVNNRAPEIAGTADCADNQQTLAALPAFAAAHPGLRLAWIDAASPGRDLGPKDGVGLARKIGLDAALALLSAGGHPNGTLISLDADTRVGPGYLDAIHAFFSAAGRWAAVVDYAHPIGGDGMEARAILSYELFLRYQEMAWHYARSPYAYPAIGSTMICTGPAYAAAGGMNRRQAGEDFYFLQQLAKTGPVGRIRSTTVVPSGRASHRVPFGTGRKVGAFPDCPDDAYRTYHPDSYRVLKDWLAAAAPRLGEPGHALHACAAAIDSALAEFLADQDFAAAWDRIRGHCATEAQRARQFHQWFDAFRTLKLTHCLRDHGYPRQDLFAALGQVMAWNRLAAPFEMEPALREDIGKQRILLGVLRQWRP